MLLAPPPESFQTRQAGIEYAQNWAQTQGYAVTISASVRDIYVYLGCDKQGQYKNSHKLTAETRKRGVSTARAGCPFKLRLKAEGVSKWKLTVVNSDHNHAASTNPVTHAVQRRIDVATKDQILELARHGTKPAQIVPLLLQREDPIQITSKDVSNLLQTHRLLALHGRAPVEALVEWLEEQNWPHEVKKAVVNEGVDRLEGIFFAHPKGLELLRRFGTILVIDATYNTNQHRLPLLHFVGVTSSNLTFTAALAFLPDESTITYTWALSALRNMVPEWTPDVVVTDDDAALGAALHLTLTHQWSHIHCQWHVRQNVVKEARTRLLDEEEFQLFMSDFDEVRDSRTLSELSDARDRLEAAWSDKRPDLVDYVDAKLSSEHLWVAAYINRHPHMGARTTSRAEGAHATMKNYLHSRHGNLYSVSQALKNHFISQHSKIEKELADDMSKVPIGILGDRFYVNLSGNVSRHALRLIKLQDDAGRQAVDAASKRGDQAIESCSWTSCTITATMGLLCWHALATLRASGQPIPLSCIHPQWQTTAGLTEIRAPRLLDPLNPNQRKIAAAVTSTGRMLTAAELAHAKKKKAVRHCRNCHQAGHNVGRCPLPCGRCKSADHRINTCLI
ncbi:hypothetical protein CF319_g9240 [Tilletia indica]|nr:hypothetical protein CF319_g9240 [Tilletia indica]